MIPLVTKEKIEKYESVKDNLKLFYIISLSVIFLLVVLALVQSNVYILTLILILPVIYIFLYRSVLFAVAKCKESYLTKLYIIVAIIVKKKLS